jgi:hypothetical protein
MGRRAILVPWLVLLAVAVAGGPAARAQGPHEAGLVIRFEESTITRCVEFEEDEITGYELLTRSGLQVMAQSTGLGSAICKIEDLGCPASNCFCRCQGSACAYWAYMRLTENGWLYSPLGASVSKVRQGQVDGWSWGAQELDADISFEQICAPSTPTAETRTASPSPTGTSVPVPATVTSPPTLTGTISSTPTPSQVAALTLAATLVPTQTPVGHGAALPADTPSSTTSTAPTMPLQVKTPADDGLGLSMPPGYVFLGLIAVGFVAALIIVLRKR